MKMMKGLELCSCEYRMKELGLFILEQRRLSGELTDIYRYLMDENEGEGPFAVEPTGMTRASGHKLEHITFHLKTSKHFFTVRMTEHWNRLPRQVVNISICGDIQNPTG